MEIIPFARSNYSLENYLTRINSRSKAIYWIIIAIVISGITVLPFIYVDVSVQARGFFQSVIDKQSVYAPFQGKLIYTSIEDGKKVRKGDTLFIIDSEALKAQHEALKKQLEENDSAITDLNLLVKALNGSFSLQKRNLRTSKYSADYDNFRKQHGIQSQKVQKTKLSHDRNETLYNQKLIPDADYENSLFTLIAEEENLNQLLLSQKAIWQSDLTQRKNEVFKQEAALRQYQEELNNRIVISPIDGEVLENLDVQTGVIVVPNQKMAEISPNGELVATCFVRPADIGLINETQKVRIQVDAFNYNEWGMLDARIMDISDDMIVENGSAAYFRIKCKPDKTFLSLKNGHKAYIKKGMSLTSRIVIIRRSLFNLLFDKTSKWFNPYTNSKQE
jgi:multidrug resistance efflux pump